MEFASLGSGSSGNCTLVRACDSVVMVDCGFTLKETERRLALLEVTPDEISAVLVTHEHSDHLKGVPPFSRKYATPVYMTEGTFHSRDHGKLPSLNLIRDYQPFTLGQLSILPVAVPHDAREPAQFIFEQEGRSLGILTDLGHVTSHIVEQYSACHGLLVEANHDLNMLANGPYPLSLQKRVSSDWGHLNNGQTCEFIQSLGVENLQKLVIGHISQKNNSVDLVKDIMAPITHLVDDVFYATQEDGFGWLKLT